MNLTFVYSYLYLLIYHDKLEELWQSRMKDIVKFAVVADHFAGIASSLQSLG